MFVLLFALCVIRTMLYRSAPVLPPVIISNLIFFFLLQVLIMPSKEIATARSLERDSQPCSIARAGDNVTVSLQGTEGNQVTAGSVICHPDYPVQVASYLELKIVVLEVATPIVIGSQVNINER